MPKKRRDPDAPKKPTTAYFHFVAERRADVQRDHPELSLMDQSRVLADLWRKLSPSERQKYDELYLRDKERYNLEMSTYTPPSWLQAANERGSKKRKDPDAPKKPLSSYFHFQAERRPVLQAENPNLKLMELSKILAEEWKALSDHEKQKYVALNKQDKERYAREMENYTPPVDTTSGKRRRDPNQPKRPMTAYFHFMQERRPIIQEQFPDMKLMDISKLLSEEWRNMSGEARAKYNELYQQDKERYAREMAEYNASSTSHNDVHDVGVVPGGWP